MSAQAGSSADLEFQIDTATLRLLTAKTPLQRREAAAEQARLIKLRSQEQIARMEQQRKLR